MASGDLITAEQQFEIWRSDTDRLLMGPGTAYGFLSSSDLDLPAVRTADVARPQGHGIIAARDLYDARHIEAEMVVYAAAGGVMMTKLSDLAKAFRVVRPGEADPVLSYRPRGGAIRQVSGRPRGIEWKNDWRAVRATSVPVGWRFDALDPRFYARTQASQLISITEGNSSNSATIANAGDTETSPILEIQGPAVNPRVSNGADANRQVKIDITLAATDTLIVDVAKKTVKLAGVDKYGNVRTDNQWFDILPGNNLITFSRTGTTGEANLTVKWRDAWATIGPGS